MATAGERCDPPQRRNALSGMVAGVGAAIAIGVMEWSSLESHAQVTIILFATSIVPVIGSPQLEPAQPRTDWLTPRGRAAVATAAIPDANRLQLRLETAIRGP